MWRARAWWRIYLIVPLLSAVTLVIGAFIGSLLRILLEHLGMSAGGSIEQFILNIVLFPLVIVLGYRIGAYMVERNRQGDDHWHRRGAFVSSHLPTGARAESGKAAESGKPDSPVTIAGLTIPLPDEVKHFKFIGTTGTGKSTGISEILSAALARGDRAIIADPDGGYLNRFYDGARGDVILNPFEPDSMKWNLLDEIAHEYDVDQLARSLIPEGSGSDRVWSDYARTFFIAVVRRLIEAGIRDDAEVFRLITKASTDELKLLVKDTIAGPFLEDNNEKMFSSVRSVTTSALRGLEYTTKGRGTPFSVRRWVREGASRKEGGRGGVLFLPYKAGEIAALKSIISAWMRIAIFEGMSRPEGDHRLWFVVDELDALGEIDGLKDALTRLRKFGGRCVLGFQSISQVSGTYGKGTADTIVENCANTLILRCSASEQGGTSQFASRLIGQREVIYQTHSKTSQPDKWFSSHTTSEHRTVEHAIMASEIERLPDLHGYLKLASRPDWYRVALSRVEYGVRARAARARGEEAEGGVAGAGAGAAGAGVAGAAAWPPAQPSPVAPARAAAADGRAATKSRAAAVKRPRKSGAKAAESDGARKSNGVAGEQFGLDGMAAPQVTRDQVGRADPAPPSLE